MNSKQNLGSDYKLTPYPWLGEIPSNWTVGRISTYTATQRKNISPDELMGHKVKHYSIPSAQEFGDGLEEDGESIDSNKLLIDRKQLLVSKLNPRKQTILIASPDETLLTVSSTEFVSLIPLAVDIQYLQYVMLSTPVLNYLKARVESATKSHQRVSPDVIIKMPWGWPPIEVQKLISNYLDLETAKIDELIQKQEKLVELLNEKRLEVIRQAITKGVNKDATFRTSNVNWIGEVPEHWKVKQLKWITPIKRGASPRPIDNPIYFNNEGEYAWVRISDVTSSEIYLTETEQRLSELGSSLSVKLEPGELFLSIAGSVGKPCITNIKACIHDGFVYFPKLPINPLWFYYMFEAKLPFGGLGKLGTQLNLNTDTIGSIYVPVPPEDEIEKIISHIEAI